MIYLQIEPFVHLILEPLNRKKFEIELIYSSGGSWFEKPQNRGKKHLLEHCIASRIKNMDYKTFKNFQFENNIFLNAFTSPLNMGLNATGHKVDGEQMLDIILEMAFQPTFDQQILDQEKEVVLREISERSGDPNYRLHYQTMEKVFTSSSYENHQTLGDSQMVKQTTIADFNSLHQENLENSHIILCLSGNAVKLEKAVSKIKQYLSQKQDLAIMAIQNEKTKKPVNFYPGSIFQDFKVLPVVNKLAHKHVDFSIYIPCRLDFNNKPVSKIFEELFLKYYGVLYSRLRDELGFVYGLYSSFNFETQNLLINLSCEQKYVKQIILEIQDVFGNFKKYYDPIKFKNLKSIITKKVDISKDTLGSETGFAQNSLLTFGVVENFDDYRKRIKKVTKQDLYSFYTNLEQGLDNKKIVLVSQDESVNEYAN
jgi:zinc protease